MKALFVVLAGSAVILATGVAVSARPPEDLKPVESFASIADQKQRAVALFTEAGKVIQQPALHELSPRR